MHHPVIVAGAGPVGLATAIDLAQRGVPVVLLDDDDTLATGSRAICFAQRTLNIFDRLGCGQKMVDKGVSWSTGRVYFQDDLVYSFDLQPEGGHRRPAFINLQQYYVERYLIERALELPNLELRFKQRVRSARAHDDYVELEIETPEGPYLLRCAYLVAADGSRSTLRAALGLEARGHTFRDRFLIADVRMNAPFPTERRFWFDPPFHRNQSALLHRQPDDTWRIDFQLGWDADPGREREPERVAARVRAMLGAAVSFELLWVSIYTFSCVRMERFRHGRVLFAGDSAHGVSPFGARGANSGVQDADNLAWKLVWVIAGRAPDGLLDSYDSERIAAADENIRHSTRSTDFITPKSRVSRIFRDATLRLARQHEFARQLVNSGRLSTATALLHSPLNTADEDDFPGGLLPGAACVDAPLSGVDGATWLLDRLPGEFTLLLYLAGDVGPRDEQRIAALGTQLTEVGLLVISARAENRAVPAPAGRFADAAGLVAERYDLRHMSCYLMRPDQHVCARWRAPDPERIVAAVRRATAHKEKEPA